MNPQKTNFRAAVLAAMKKRGWTAYRLGKECGIPPSDIQRWLDTRRKDHQPHITTKRLEPICAALGLKIDKEVIYDATKS